MNSRYYPHFSSVRVVEPKVRREVRGKISSRLNYSCAAFGMNPLKNDKAIDMDIYKLQYINSGGIYEAVFNVCFVVPFP
jgi:hypothetical protein